MTAEQKTDILEAKRRAKAELLGYRERLQAEREAKRRADQTVDEEIAEAIRARRSEEARVEEIRAERARIYAEREARIQDIRKAEAEQRALSEPRQLAETSARRLARMLRLRLGSDFDAIVADIKSVDFGLFKSEVARIPEDERAEALNAKWEALAAQRAAEAATLPIPEDQAERAILAKFGFA